MRKAWLGVLSLGVVGLLGPGCSGAEFSGAPEPDGSAGNGAAGEPTDAGGGAGAPSGGASAGSSSVAGEGGAATGEGGVATGEGGVSTGESGAAGVGGAPLECRLDELPAQVAGDCKRWDCVAGKASRIVDTKDLPTARGTCDVPSCTEAGPALHGDDNKCVVNKQCVEGNCACRACPNGKIANTVADSCLMPAGVTAAANKTLMGSTAAGAIDGTTAKTWNSGAVDGTLTLTLAAPQAMTALVIYVTGQDGNGSMAAKTITVNATVELSDSPTVVTKSGTWDFTSAPTGPIRLELGLVKATKITLKLASPSSWIAVNEVLFVVCS